MKFWNVVRKIKVKWIISLCNYWTSNFTVLLFLPFVIESLNLLAFPELCFLLDLHVTCYGAVQENKSCTKYPSELLLLEVTIQIFEIGNKLFYCEMMLSIWMFVFYLWDNWKPSLHCGYICLYFFNYGNIILFFYNWYFFCFGIKWQIRWTAEAVN